MKIILAPDKFKSCMTSPQVCEIMEKAIRDVLGNVEIISIPMADGGEGTVDAIMSAVKGKIRKVNVADPFGKKVEAKYCVYNSGRSAIMETASASGMELVPRDKLNPMLTTTYGTGELILAAIDAGVQEITIGIGGSATIDGGAGMAQALGYRLLDNSGSEIPCGGGGLSEIASIDTSDVDKRLFKVKFNVACDVKNPLLGPEGASEVYGPQKGATPEMVKTLENNLAKLSALWLKDGMLDSVKKPGDGAAGGLGAGLRAFCKANLVSGARLVMKETDFWKHLTDADIVITGEGCADSQTGSGKLCSEIAYVSHEAGVPVILLCGALKGKLEFFSDFFDFVFCISNGHTSLDEAIATAPANLRFTVMNVARLLGRSRYI